MLLKALNNPWAELVTNLVIVGVGLAVVAYGYVAGYAVVIFGATAFTINVVQIRRRRTQAGPAESDVAPRS